MGLIGLADAHARGCARHRVEQVQARVGLLVRGGGAQHHAFGHAELHLARRQVGHQHGQLADQLFRLVGRLDARENVAVAAFTYIEGQAQQLAGALDVLSVDDSGDTQVDLC